MLFITDAMSAFELAAVADAASSDTIRPILRRVQLQIENRSPNDVVLRAVATDSYMLVKRELHFEADHYPFIVEDDPKEVSKQDTAKLGEGVTVDAKAWKKALKDVASERVPVDAVLIDINANNVTMARQASKAAEITIPTMTAADGTYPKWGQLFGERETSGRFDTLPAFNAELLRRMENSLSAKPADRGKYPVRLVCTKSTTSKPGDASMRPWMFWTARTAKFYRSEYEAIIMPTRVADAA